VPLAPDVPDGVPDEVPEAPDVPLAAPGVVLVLVVDVEVVDVVDVPESADSVGVVPVGTVSAGVVFGTSTETEALPHAATPKPDAATTPAIRTRTARGDGRNADSR
jgi:hypothetical protein